MTTAVQIITDAYERLNRLYPGETLNADDAAVGFTRLNLLVDEMAAQVPFLFKDVLTSAAQTGNITLAAGSWSTIPAGTRIKSVTQNGYPLSPITMQQYNETYDVTTSGTPVVWAQDGVLNVYFVPVPNGQTIKIQTQVGATEFADQTTSYTLIPGYKNYLGIALAVRLAPKILGKMPAELLRDETKASRGVKKYGPMILNVATYANGNRRGNILNGW